MNFRSFHRSCLAVLIGAALAAAAAERAGRAQEAVPAPADAGKPAAVVAGPPAGAAGPADKTAAETLRFRRVYVPSDRPKEWPDLDQLHVPIDRSEFEQLLKRALAASTARTVGAVRTTSAVYHARLVGTQLADGRATLAVQHSGDAPAMLVLSPCALAILGARWVAPTKAPVKATVGLGPDGKLETRVESTGQLEFDWALTGRRDAAETLLFPFQLPPCPINRLVLDLPANLVPTADRGIVLRVDQLPPGDPLTGQSNVAGTRRVPSAEAEPGKAETGTVDGTPRVPATFQPPQGHTRWQIELGGHQSFVLRVVPAGASQQRPKLALVRQTVAYDFSLHGVEVLAQLKVEVHDEPLSEIVVAVDPELQLLAARHGDALVPWSSTRDDQNKVTRVVLAPPEPIGEAGCVLELRAMAPLVTGRLWRLPRIRPEGMLWQEGSATLLVPHPLLIRQLVPDGCWQSDTAPLSGKREGESAQFQYFSPDATVAIVLSQQREPLELASGTAVTVGGSEMTASVATDLRITDASRFSLSADVSPRWMVDSVESRPPDAIDDWSLQRQGGQRTLIVRLAKALSPSRPVRLTVAARRFHPASGGELTVDDVVPLRFRVSDAPRSGAQDRRFVALQAVDPFQLELAGAEDLDRIDPQTADAATRELFAEPPRGLMFKDNAGAAKLRIALKPQSPTYSGAVRMEAAIVEGKLQETYTLRCVPKSARVERLIVHFSRRRPAPLRWTLGADDSQQLSVRQWSSEEQTRGLMPPEGETWELTFRRPRSVPFEVVATRVSSPAAEEPLCLASLPEAIGQDATLVVRSSGVPNVRIKNYRLTPIAAEPVPKGQYQTALATFRYEPLRDAVGGEPAVAVSPLPDAGSLPAWIWSCRLVSRYEPDGRAQHLATWRLQNRGARKVRFSLAGGEAAENVRGVWVDESPVAWRSDKDDAWIVDLPAGREFPTVVIHFATQGSRLGPMGALGPPFPEVDLPVLSRHWTVWLPPGYEVCSPDPRWEPFPAASEGLSQRLFGILGRGHSQGPFNPLRWESWDPTADRSARREAEDKARRLVQSLGGLAAGQVAGTVRPGLPWAGLLSHQAVDSIGLDLRIDREALAEIGVFPQSPVGAVQDADPSSRGARLLEEARLALLVAPGEALLTSQARAATDRQWLLPAQDQGLWWIEPGPLRDQLHRAASGDEEDSFVSAAGWKAQPQAPRAPWLDAGLAGLQESDLYGWSRRELTPPLATTVRLRYIHRETVGWLGTLMFLFVVAIGWWKGSNRPATLVWVAGGFGAAALLLPEACAPIASGGLLGALFCLALRLICRPDASGLNGGAAQTTRFPVAPPASWSIWLVATLSGGAVCSAAFGQQPPAKPAAPSPVYQVLIPIDEKEQPAEGKIHVPGELYNRLRQRAGSAGERPQGWLLSAATYRGALSREPSTDRLVLDQLKAVLEFDVFDQGARVRIPWQRGGTNLMPNGVTLDGRIIQPEWDPDADALTFDVPQQGQYRLELSLRPQVRRGEGPAGFDLTIPPLASSRLELLLPAGVPKIEVPSAAGPVRVQDDPLRLLADLGPAAELSVRWPRDPGDGAAPAIDVEELLWLKVQPGSVALEARFKFKVLEGQVRTVRLAADPRLRLLPLEGEGAPSAQIGAVPGEAHAITLQWPQPIAGEAVVDGRFLLTGTSGIGNLRLPKLEALDARTTRRWIAVSLDPRLESSVHESGGGEAISVAEFVAHWGTVDRQPDLAFRLALGDAAWTLATRAKKTLTAVEQNLALVFDRETTEVYFDARLTPKAGYNFQHRLLIADKPDGLQVEQVSVKEDGIERAVRFSQEASGALTVFLTGPVTGPHQLSLRGRFPTKTKTALVLPRVDVDQGQVLSSTIEVFRRPPVLVSVERAVAKGAAAKEPGAAAAATRSFDARPARLVGTYRIEGDPAARPSATVSLNEPQVRAEQVTRLRSEGMQWTASVDFHVHAAGGVVDQFLIDVPHPVDGPYRVTAAVPATIREVTLPNNRRQLVVRPEKAIDGEHQFTLSSPIALSPSDRPFAPKIAMERTDALNQLLVLPTSVQGQPVAWETRSLTPARLPDALALPADAEATVTYRAVSRSFQAILKRIDPTPRGVQVSLADVRLAWHADGACYGVAAFDLDPGRSSEVALRMPSLYTLIAVSVAGVPAVPETTAPHTWRVPLGPEQLPQRIEVLFTGMVAEASRAGARRFEAPTLENLAVDETLWTVAGPPMFEAAPPDENSRIDAWQWAFVHLKNASDRIETASMLTLENPSETQRWYRPWAQRLVAAHAAVQRELSLAERPGADRKIRSAVAAIDQKQTQIAAHLGTSAILAELRAGALAAADPIELWEQSLDPSQTVSRRRFLEAAGAITLDYRPTDAASPPWRMTLVVLLVVVATVVGLRRGTLAEWFKRWPAAAGVAVGLFWWLWLSPSVLGWAIILVSLIVHRLGGWKRTSAPSGSSIIALRPESSRTPGPG